MATETTTIRIKSERLGSVQTVRQLLTDIENAYNSIYAFDFLVDTLSSDRKRQLQLLDDHSHYLRKFWKDISIRERFPFDPFLFELFWNRYYYQIYNRAINLLELQSKLDINKIVLPEDRLSITKINIQSPGFWEFAGSLNPLQQIREYINDRHERNKDRKFRSSQEEKLGDLEIEEKKNKIVNEKIEILKKLGYSETEIRQLILTMVDEPLNKIGNHQDNKQIDGIDDGQK